MNRIDRRFRQLKSQRRKALILFITAGYPNLKTTERLVLEFEKCGADIIELGVPFSDPIADGPVIQMSSYESLKAGTTLKKVLALVSALRRKTQIPLAAMSYFNPILQYGVERFARDAGRAGLDAVIVPDLPPDEEPDFVDIVRRSGLHMIMFVAPTTSEERLRMIGRRAKGFLYAVSLTGVTGARRRLPEELKTHLAHIKKSTSTPVCAGFGISSPAQARLVASYGDGVIVGSAIVQKIKENLKQPSLVSRVGRFVKQLKV